MSFHHRIIIRISPGSHFPPEADSLWDKSVGVLSHTAIRASQFGYSETHMRKKRKETDTAECFSSSLTLALAGGGMEIINKAIYTWKALTASFLITL